MKKNSIYNYTVGIMFDYLIAFFLSLFVQRRYCMLKDEFVIVLKIGDKQECLYLFIYLQS